MSEELNGAREAARDLLTCVDVDDPHDLAGELLGMLTRAQRQALLEHAAELVLTEANRWMRAQSAPVGRSWKAGISSADLLAQRYCVEGTWITLGQCNRTQVLWIAQDYRERAARNLAHADDMERLAAEMEQAGAETVADLFDEQREAA